LFLSLIPYLFCTFLSSLQNMLSEYNSEPLRRTACYVIREPHAAT
jgi:hypothetical protein